MKKNKTYDEICDLLEKNERSGINGATPRDSDKVLIIQYLQLKLGLDLNEEQVRKLYAAPSLESIRRTRAKLQEQGKYLGSPEVMQKRRVKGYELQQTVPAETPSGVQARIANN